MKRYCSLIFSLSLLLEGCIPIATQPHNVTPLEVSVISATDTPILSTATPTALPTVAPSPTPIILFDENSDAYRIQFPPMSTWVSIHGHLENGKPQRYVLKAMQGQVMGISTAQRVGIKISDKNGTILNDENYPSWHGVLPATQDYFITVGGKWQEGDFDLRISINPIGGTKQFFTFFSQQDMLAIGYPDYLAPVNFPYNYDQYLKGTPVLSLFLIDNKDYEGTNLGEAYFILAIGRDPQSVSACTQPTFPNETSTGEEIINGIRFNKSVASDAAASNIYEETIYRTTQKNYCYEVIFFLHYGSIGVFTPGTIREFDRNSVMQKLHEALESFTMK